MGIEEGNTFQISERATLKMAESVMSNYRDAQLALLDLVDNAVDNRVTGKQETITLNISRERITIMNTCGEGLDLQGLTNFFNWGHSTKGGWQIGQYGVGGKAAMGFLAKSLEIRCSPQGSDTEYRIFDPDWESKQEETEKIHQGEKRTALTEDGYFRVVLSNLKKHPDPTKMIERLGSVYRPLLANRSIKIIVNNREVQPTKLDYMESDPNYRSERLSVGTGFGDSVELKVGVSAEGTNPTPGFRCYYRGRLIKEGEFFGQPTPAQVPQASRLIGEAHLDVLGVTTNKSDFIEDPKWEDVRGAIHQALIPWYEKLDNLKIEQTYQVDKFEKDLVKQTKKNLEHILGATGLITKADLAGEAGFRLPPSHKETERHFTGKTRKPSEPKGATPPDIKATVGPNIKRWGALSDWDVVNMGNGDKPCEVVNENGRLILKINADFSMYQTAKTGGFVALQLYIAQVATREICQIVRGDQSVAEYVALVQELERQQGLFYGARLSMTNKRALKSRGSIPFNQ